MDMKHKNNQDAMALEDFEGGGQLVTTASTLSILTVVSRKSMDDMIIGYILGTKGTDMA
jgi:hypothetical protein